MTSRSSWAASTPRCSTAISCDRSPFSFVVRGEGGVALPRLCSALERKTDLGEVPNLTWCTEDGKIVRNPIGQQIHKQDLGEYPLPDYDRLPEGRYKGVAIPVVTRMRLRLLLL